MFIGWAVCFTLDTVAQSPATGHEGKFRILWLDKQILTGSRSLKEVHFPKEEVI